MSESSHIKSSEFGRKLLASQDILAFLSGSSAFKYTLCDSLNSQNSNFAAKLLTLNYFNVFTDSNLPTPST